MDHDGAIRRNVGDDYWIKMSQSGNVSAMNADSWTLIGTHALFGEDAWIIIEQSSDVLAMILGS